MARVTRVKQMVSAGLILSGLVGSAPATAALVTAIPLKEAPPCAAASAAPAAAVSTTAAPVTAAPATAATMAPAAAAPAAAVRAATVLAAAASAATVAAAPPAADAVEAARALVRRAIDAQGGEARLREITSLKIELIGHRYLLEQSERPEGPWIPYYEQRTELRDLAAGRLRTSTAARAVQTSTWTPDIVTLVDTAGSGAAAYVRGETRLPGRPQLVRDAADLLAFEPERLLLTALAAADLRQAPDERLQGVAQHVMTFRANGRAARLLLNAHTLLPTAVDVVADDGDDMWGEVTRRTLFSYWNLESNGLFYPRQRNVLWNGVPQSEVSVTSLTINPPIEAESFAIPEAVRTAYANAPRTNARLVPLGQRSPTAPSTPLPAASGTTSANSATARPSAAAPAVAPTVAVETLADGVIQISGLWNVGMVRQSDGVVIIEAPISSEYSAQVLDDAAKRFPGVPVKAVITTSDAWPHLGGVREYAARGIPIYALDLNKPILDRLLAARYAARPDRLARAPRAATLRLVSDRTVIGSGAQLLVLHPIRGENGERMMLVHLPGLRLLYTSDEIMYQSRKPGDFFMPSYLVDVQQAMQRAGIPAVDRVFGMHLAPTAWSVIDAAITKARPAPAAGGTGSAEPASRP